MPHATQYAATVDRLAIIKRDIAELQAEESALKQTLIDTGLHVIEGNLHRASISTTARTLTDWAAIAQHFSPSRQLITAHTKQGATFSTVRISAHRTN